MKAALEAWGAGSNLFHQGAAKETDAPDVVAATMARPGVVLKRAAGSNGRFAEHAGLPTDISDETGAPKKARSPAKRRPAPRIGDKDARKAAANFDREQKRRDAERRKEEAAREKERARREKAIAKAQAALDKAQREHERRAEALDAERAAIEKPRPSRRRPLGERQGEADRGAAACAGVGRQHPVNHDEPLRKKKSRRPLETFFGVPNFFGVAITAAGTPSGSRDLSRAPDGVRSLLVPILLQGGFGYEV
ncbi:MAG TPA: hypothetical protein VH682_02685 [Gemmataceae bacterium]|jgi:hypothetical protein